jgi:hypothetical protein
MAYETRNPGNACISSAWSAPDALQEARSMLTLMKRDNLSVEHIKKLICVSDGEFAELNQWASSDPPLAGAIDAVMNYRQKVLDSFLLLIEIGAEPVILTTAADRPSKFKSNYSRLPRSGYRSGS